MSQALIWAAGGTGFTFLMTTLGAAYGISVPRRNQYENTEGLSGICGGSHDCGVRMVPADPCD